MKDHRLEGMKDRQQLRKSMKDQGHQHEKSKVNCKVNVNSSGRAIERIKRIKGKTKATGKDAVTIGVALSSA